MPAAIAFRFAGVHAVGSYVLGSMRNPTIPAMPRPAQTSAATESPWLARRDAMSAATGMGQGAATPAPQPTMMPVGTESGTPMPSGRPGRSSRTATAVVNPTVHANAMAAFRRARPVSSVIELEATPDLEKRSRAGSPLAVGGRQGGGAMIPPGSSPITPPLGQSGPPRPMPGRAIGTRLSQRRDNSSRPTARASRSSSVADSPPATPERIAVRHRQSRRKPRTIPARNDRP